MVRRGGLTAALLASLALPLLPACSSSSGTPTPAITAAPGSGNVATTGVAYIPDGGNSGGVKGIQVVHFENINGNLLSSPASSGVPAIVGFPGAVGPLAFASDGSTSISADTPSGGTLFTQLQDITGVNVSSLTPVGAAYDTTQVPTPQPSPSGSPNATPTPAFTPLISNVTGLAIAGTANNSIALAVGAGGDGILGVSSLNNAPPVFANDAPFNGSYYTAAPVAEPSSPTNVTVAADSTEALVRGPSDLIAFQLSSTGMGFEFNATSFSAALGAPGSGLLGRGAMAFDPTSDSMALVAQAAGNPNAVTLVGNLPGSITSLFTLTLGTTPRSLAWVPGGAYAVVGADGGYYTLSGMGSRTLNLASMTPSDPSFIGCDGASHTLKSVTSIGVSNDGRYVALYGPSDAASCPGANLTGSLVVVPFVAPGTTPTPAPAPTAGATPAPSMFVQNNLTAPGSTQDYMLVR